jgi:hypothetical protein
MMNGNMVTIVLVIIAFGAGFATAKWLPADTAPAEKSAAATAQKPTPNQTARESFQAASEQRATPAQVTESSRVAPLWRSMANATSMPAGMPRPITFQADPGEITTNQKLSLDVYGSNDAQVEIFEASDVADGKRIRGRLIPSQNGGEALMGSLMLDVRGERVSGSLTTNKGRFQIAGSRQRASLIDPNFMMGAEGPMGRQMGGPMSGPMSGPMNNNMPYRGDPRMMRNPVTAPTGRTP